MPRDKSEKPWRVSIDLEEGEDIIEGYPDERSAMERAKMVMTTDYVVSQTLKKGGKMKVIFHPVRQIKSVTVDHDDE